MRMTVFFNVRIKSYFCWLAKYPFQLSIGYKEENEVFSIIMQQNGNLCTDMVREQEI